MNKKMFDEIRECNRIALQIAENIIKYGNPRSVRKEVNMDELLTFKQLSERTGINENAFQKQAQFDDDFPVQRWTVPFRVSWTAFLEYCKKKH